MNDVTRTCLKCDAAVRFLLCDRHYAETPFSAEPIETGRDTSVVVAPVGMNAVVDGVWRA